MYVVFTVARLIKPVIICEVLKNEWALQAKRCLENMKFNVLIFIHVGIKGHVFACSVNQG